MCTFQKTNGELCKLSPKKELCHKHINAAAPVAEEAAIEEVAPIEEVAIEEATDDCDTSDGEDEEEDESFDAMAETALSSAGLSPSTFKTRLSLVKKLQCAVSPNATDISFLANTDAVMAFINASSSVGSQKTNLVHVMGLITACNVDADFKDFYGREIVARKEQLQAESGYTPAIEETISETESSSSEESVDEPALPKTGTLVDCKKFLAENAVGKYCQEYRLINKDTSEYVHSPKDAVVLRVQFADDRRAFFWFFNESDAVAFNEFVGATLKLEAHEIFTTPRCRMFFDIDLALPEMELDDVAAHYGIAMSEYGPVETMDRVGQQLAKVYIDALKTSLEEHGVTDDELHGFDWMHTMRNRQKDDGDFKISVHVTTNIMLTIEACAAIVNDIKENTIGQNSEALGLPEDYVSLFADAIDASPYAHNKSLGMPFGCKHGLHHNRIIRQYTIPGQKYLLTRTDQFSLQEINVSKYNISSKSSFTGSASCPEFVKRSLEHVSDIPGYTNDVWDIDNSVLKGSCMYVKRYKPSHCSVCDRTHDNDNTLFLTFNSDSGVAFWKCIRSKTKASVFYREEPGSDDNDLDAFASNFTGKLSSSTTPEIEEPDDPVAMATSKSKSKYVEFDFPQNPKVQMMDETDDDFFARVSEDEYFEYSKLLKIVSGKLEVDQRVLSNSTYKPRDLTTGRNILELCHRTKSNLNDFVPAMVLPVSSKRLWRSKYVKPLNQIIMDQMVNWSDFKAICGDCIFNSADGCARFAAFFLDKCLVMTSNNLILRNNFDQNSDDSTDQKREDLPMKLIFHFENEKGKLKNITLAALLKAHGSYFHEYNRVVMKWDHDPTKIDEFSLCTPFRGRVLPDDDYDAEFLKPCLDWIFDTIANGEKANYDAIIDWLEHTMRFKNAKAGVCLVLYSTEKGTGKSVFLTMVESIIGGYNTAIESGSISRTVGDRNAHIMGKKVALIDELKSCSSSDKKDIEKFKTMITQDRNACTPLYSRTIKIDNRLNFVLCTNNINGLYVPNATGEIADSLRRFNFLQVGKKHLQDKSFYDPFVKYIKTQKFADHMVTFLHKRSNLADSRPLECLITELTHQISKAQMSAVPAFWTEIREQMGGEMYIPFTEGEDGSIRIIKRDAFDVFRQQFCPMNNFKFESITKNKFTSMSTTLTFICDKRSNGSDYFIVTPNHRAN